ncbi:hypothetical protein SDRG_03781 [Saprolegnia diclina VS20]|uniref:Proteasome assembly chaperone 1 n=1 Tax=Saprolegnia diclina (strain VS20) TaxID=1156394 RepID=T0S7S5_SAPDV|nr:hypothetical protein SDRG_03781 [Saprolegnia diclina VS20]EQC38822.1 hypothetical protein SDRG_03781 [Saprolegnia diclina VS20]|eukprot:XP_008607646.1 hypothetical protein SDRG_03781 [Saprolegnia diclina VS20]
MSIPGTTVVLGYCDLAAAGARLLHHIYVQDAALLESSLTVLGLTVAIRTYAETSVSFVVVRDPVPDALCTAFAAELTDLLVGKRVVLLTAPNVPLSSADERFVFWTQYHATAPLSGLSSALFRPIPLAKWTLKDAFLCACLHFFQVEALPLTVLLVRGYKYTGRATDGSAEAIAKLGEALPSVLQALDMPTAFEVDVKSASVMKMLSMHQAARGESSVLYN